MFKCQLIKRLSLMSLVSFAILIGHLHAQKSSVFFESGLNLNKNSLQKGEASSLGTQIIHQSQNSQQESRIDFSGKINLSTGKLAHSLSEAYYQFDFGQLSGGSLKGQLGRFVLPWSSSESFWGLTYFQGNRQFGLFDFKKEGKLGGHLSYSSKNYFAEIFASYFYLPQFNPEIEVEEGKVSSNMNWSKLPPRQTVIKEKLVPIEYSMNKPQLSDVLFHLSLGPRLGLNWRFNTRPGTLSAYALYAPENQLRINGEAYYDLQKKSVQVEANPLVNHQMLYGVSVKQEISDRSAFEINFNMADPNGEFKTDLGVMDPIIISSNERKVFQSKFFKILPSYEKTAYLSASWAYHWRYFLVKIHGLELLSQHTDLQDDFYSDTVKWKRAMGVDLDVFLSENLQGRMKFFYDFLREDNILNLELKYSFLKGAQVQLGVELIESPQSNSYWSVYRANDRFYGQLSYHY